ncbi:MAG: chaperone NapD [Rhodospirillaceae bacterium]|jgi:nitrate reductase NapD|nr:chaperone NapD [Rhodospirillaceae bacterium]
MSNSEPTEVHISGYVVQAQPIQVEAITAAIDEMAGAEIHGANEHGKMVLTLETTKEEDIAERIIEINSLPGVINTALVYHQIDEEPN